MTRLRIFIFGVALMGTLGVALTHSGVAYAASDGCPSNINDDPNIWEWQQVAVTDSNVGGEAVAVVIEAAINHNSLGGGGPLLCYVLRSISVVNMTQPGGQIITNTYGIGPIFNCDGGPCPTFTQGNWILPNHSGQVVAYTSSMVFGSCAVANMYFKNVLTQVRAGC